tara:strand:+ start:953 stop:2962 length:2010 start_codon:yes stop_codon:yes gene_type:complete
MAKYERQVTNKYYGAGSGGKVYTNTQSDGLAKSLSNAGYKIGKAEDLRIDRKKDKAVSKINEMYASGKTFEDINAEILAGQHPELTGKYIDATTNYHAGRVKASEVIKEIEANKNKYDFTDKSQSLETFYKAYMPNFDGMDSSAILGFSTLFNQFKSKDAMIDANNRSTHASNVKIEEGVTILDTMPTELIKTNLAGEFNSFKTPVPNSDGSGKINQLYTNKEAISVLVRSVQKVIALAETEDDLERAEAILSANLGIGKDGQDIKSLGSRNTKEVLKLKEDLLKKRRALIINDRTTKDKQEKEDIRALNASIFEKVQIESSTADIKGADMPMRDKNHVELMAIRDELEKFGVPAYVTNFDRLMNDNEYIDNDPAIYNELVSSIYDGEFSSQEEIADAINNLNIDPRLLSPTLTLFTKWQTSSTKQGSVHATNTTYKEGLKYIENAVRGNFTSGGILKENGNQAIRNAHNYMKVELYNFENNYALENKGKTPSTFEREAFMKQMGDIVIKNFSEGNLEPSMKTMPEYEAEIKEAEEAKKVKDEKYETVGIPEMTQTITDLMTDNQLGNNKLIKEVIDNFDPSFAGIPFTGGDSSFGETDAESFVRYKNEQLPTIVAQILDGSNFSQTQMDAMEQGDYENLVKSIATGLGKDVTVEIVDMALTILRGKNK